jgi:hypothetical protein
MKKALTSLVGKIDGLLKVEVTVTYNETSMISVSTRNLQTACTGSLPNQPISPGAAKIVRSVTKDRVSADYDCKFPLAFAA